MKEQQPPHNLTPSNEYPAPTERDPLFKNPMTTEQDLERVRVAILTAMGINPVTHSYKYVAQAAIAAMPLKDGLEPKEGALALCSLGYLGVIEGLRDGRWYGKSMYDHTKSWSSSKPRVLGYMPNKHEKAVKDK